MSKTNTKTAELPVEVQVSAARVYQALYALECRDPAAWDAIATILGAASPHDYYQDRARDAARQARYHASVTRLPDLG